MATPIISSPQLRRIPLFAEGHLWSCSVALQVSKCSVLPNQVTRSVLVAVVPVRLLTLPIPLEIALYARPEASRTPPQGWLVDFLHRHLVTPPPGPAR